MFNKQTIEELRLDIQSIDAQILALIGNRLSIVRQIGKIKKDKNLPVRVPEYEAEQLEHARLQAKALGYSEKLAEEILEVVVKYSIELQQNLMES